MLECHDSVLPVFCGLLHEKGCRTFMSGPSITLLFHKVYFIYKMPAFRRSVASSVLTIRSSHVFLRLLHFFQEFVCDRVLHVRIYHFISQKEDFPLFSCTQQDRETGKLGGVSVRSVKTLN